GGERDQRVAQRRRPVEHGQSAALHRERVGVEVAGRHDPDKRDIHLTGRGPLTLAFAHLHASPDLGISARKRREPTGGYTAAATTNRESAGPPGRVGRVA